MAQKITPNLWFDGNAKEAADFYVAVFQNSKITGSSKYPESKEEGLADFQQDLAGKYLTIDFELDGLAFTGINAGPNFKINPAISFMVNFDPSKDPKAKERLDELWGKLSDGGEALMPLQEYPFSKHYGWIKDKYDVTWQLILTNPEGEERPHIIPSLLFTEEAGNKAGEAIDYYISVFKDSKIGNKVLYTKETDPARDGLVMFADFSLNNEWLTAMDSGMSQGFTFNEGVSLSVICKDQTEIDYFWEKLSAVPEAEQCGWCKDKFGVSWQIIPENMGELMKKPDAFKNMMDMHKIEIGKF